MPNLSFNAKRAVAGIGLAVCLLCLANYYFDWGMFGRFAKQGIALGFLLMALLTGFFGPTLSELYDYRERKRKQDELES